VEIRMKSALMWAAADALGMTLKHEKGKITGSMKRDVSFGNLPVTFGMQVVSSWLDTHCHMFIVKVVGNLALFLTVAPTGKDEDVRVHLLNLAKMPGKAESWLEEAKPTSAQDAGKLLGKAVVKSFRKVGKNKWAEVA